VGKDGQTKFAIENTTRTRIVIADKRVHILGTFADINVARNALVSLILGSPPNKIYAQLKNVAARMKDH
jgi:RNA-binding protein PNO1